jgi:hypothetical protein
LPRLADGKRSFPVRLRAGRRLSRLGEALTSARGRRPLEARARSAFGTSRIKVDPSPATLSARQLAAHSAREIARSQTQPSPVECHSPLRLLTAVRARRETCAMPGVPNGERLTFFASASDGDLHRRPVHRRRS